MLETGITFLITVGSAVLFAYWFRYTCLLILSAKTTRDYAGEVARANGLSFLEIQARLRDGAEADLDPLQISLDRDYALVTLALGQTEATLEDRMLRLNYRLTSLWYQAVRRVAPSSARSALDEMSMMISHFANAMGERAAGSAAA